ncbi:unnamed protein product [Lactuca virosa]|uniref:Uncharacterized protein n=1 Tax=Lactuca virosa TaxID=75947 RepID=A0AAU9PIU4_9ASTR|nr:unnamed protein product [Lactuca virosa]
MSTWAAPSPGQLMELHIGNATWNKNMHISNSTWKLMPLAMQSMKTSSNSFMYEYVDNENLEKWLHGGDAGPSSPLTWDI